MDSPANPNEKPGDHLEFADEFAGTDLDRTKWRFLAASIAA